MGLPRQDTGVGCHVLNLRTAVLTIFQRAVHWHQVHSHHHMTVPASHAECSRLPARASVRGKR